MLVSAFDLFNKAKKEGYAIGAFNTSSLEITKAIIEAAEELKSPVIIETSEGEIDFLTPEVVVAEVKALAHTAKIPVVLHLDHGKSAQKAKLAIEAGYTSVHLDGSSLAYQENVFETREIVKFAHDRGISVEGEIGHITGSSEAHNEEIVISLDTLTDPEEAAHFAAETGIDVLAVAIGNIHGVYKNPPKLDFDRMEEIAKKVDRFFSLHGGSGIPKSQIEKAISLGIVKINVNTELRMAFHDGILHEFEANPDEVVPYKFLPAGSLAVKKVVEQKIKLFGSSGKT
jgi:fructose-bisphosphate aldolase, class II